MNIPTAQDGLLWCCRHKWTLRYLVFVVTLELILQILQIRGVL